MKILFVSAEVYPYSKVGGLGDVAGALPGALAKTGVEIVVVTPAYGTINRQSHNLESSPYGFSVQLENETVDCGLSRWISPGHSNHRIYFVENEQYFGSRGIYENKSGKPYKDNDKRFLLLSKASLEICNVLHWTPDLIHCHDNHTALMPVYLKTRSPDYSHFQNTKTLLTLHNIAYQGIVSMKRQRIYKLPDELFNPTAPMEWYGQINPLKAGIVFADAVSTVSPTHAKEITTDEVLSAGLKSVIYEHQQHVFGILNGVDYSEWNPATDIFISKQYSPGSLGDKRINKVALLDETGLDNELLDKPLIGMVSRLVEQKGIPVLLEALDRIMIQDVGLIILGSGDESYHQELRKYAKLYEKRLKIDFSYNNPLSHKIMAGCDIFLMPSRYEPCGITQMVSLKYGAVPVVHKTGGLADTVMQWNGQQGNGFLFSDYSADDLVKSISRAVSIYYIKEEWQQIMLNGMKADFSWRQSAGQYLALYKQLIKE
jgi:starch synthase